MVVDNDKILIDRYLRQELTPSEKIMLEERIKQEKDLADYMIQMKHMTTAMRTDQLKEKMKMLQSTQLEGTDTTSQPKSLKLWWLLGLFVFGLLVGYLSSRSGSEQSGPSPIYAEMFGDDFRGKYVRHKVKRASTLGDLTAEQSRAYTLYEAMEFERAIPYLKDLWETDQDSTAYYYLGISYLGIGEDEKGEKILEILGEDVSR